MSGESITYLDAEGAQRTGGYWSGAPSVAGFVRCMYLRRDGLWIAVGTATKDRKVRQIAATQRPGQSLEHTGDGFAIVGAQS